MGVIGGSVSTETQGLINGPKDAKSTMDCQIEKKLHKAAIVNSAVHSMEATLISSEMSKADIKKSIALLGAKYGLQVVPMYLSPVVLGAQGPSQGVKKGKKAGKATIGSANTPAAWKTDPEYLKLQARREEVVRLLKQTADEALQQTLKKEIAALNVAMKNAKIAARERLGQ